MRNGRKQLALAVLLGISAAAWAQAPALRALQAFQPGQWQVTPIGSGPPGEAHSRCLADPEPILVGSRPGAQCSFTIISDSDDAGVVTYRCAGGRTGRTAVRRDAGGLYTVDAQGVDSGRPFAVRAEWRRTGAC